MDSLDQLIGIMKDEIMSAADETDKFNGGNKSAGTRVRKHMQNIKSLAQRVRTEVQEIKNA